MHLTIYSDPHRFIARTRDVFLQNEALNSLILGISSGLARVDILTEYTSAPYLATVEDDANLALAAVMTPPHSIILYGRSDAYQPALELLQQDIYTRQLPLPGCNGPAQLTSDFARLWQQRTGQSYHIDTHERLFSLASVTPPPATPGILRPATDNDFALVNRWLLAFHQETHTQDNLDQQLFETANRRKLHDGDIYLWELPQGETVSLAGKTRPLFHTISIAPVYTPPTHRGKGYASNCVATLTQQLLESGWQNCCLFTDLANPTSNSIYQKIGYRPLCDFNIYRFEL